MHTIYIDTQYKNESKHSEMGPVRQNPIQRTVWFVHMCNTHRRQSKWHVKDRRTV